MAAILPASRITDKQSLQGSRQATTKVYSGISAGRLLGCWAVGLLGCWAVGLLGYWAIGLWWVIPESVR